MSGKVGFSRLGGKIFNRSIFNRSIFNRLSVDENRPDVPRCLVRGPVAGTEYPGGRHCRKSG